MGTITNNEFESDDDDSICDYSEDTSTSTRTNNEKKKRKSTTKSCSTTSQTNVAPCGDDELLIPIANSAESTLQSTINLYIENSLRHYKDEDEIRILLGCCYRDVPDDHTDTSIRTFLTENGIATFSN